MLAVWDIYGQKLTSCSQSQCSKQDKTYSLRIIDEHDEKNNGQDGPIIICLYGSIATDQPASHQQEGPPT